MIESLNRRDIELTNDDRLFENQWLNSKEAASFFRTSTQQIRNWVYQGKLKAYKLFGERKLYFKLSDLEACLQPVGGFDEG